MKPFRKNVALAIDGGGIKGVIVTRALEILEKEIGASVGDIFRLAAGTSTGAIISGGIARGLSASRLHRLYVDFGSEVFKTTLRKKFFPISRYRYSPEPLIKKLVESLGNPTLGDLWNKKPQIDLVITTFDILENKTRFVKPWKSEYRDWPLVQAIMASSSVPTYFPVVAGRFIDGGVGSYANPCYLASFEAQFCLGWNPADTTVISLGTGASPHYLESGQVDRWYPWQWLGPILGAFLQSADQQQVGLTGRFFQEIDFRRFQIGLLEPIEMDDASKIQDLVQYGELLGRKILRDETDAIPDFTLMPSSAN